MRQFAQIFKTSDGARKAWETRRAGNAKNKPAPGKPSQDTGAKSTKDTIKGHRNILENSGGSVVTNPDTKGVAAGTAHDEFHATPAEMQRAVNVAKERGHTVVRHNDGKGIGGGPTKVVMQKNGNQIVLEEHRASDQGKGRIKYSVHHNLKYTKDKKKKQEYAHMFKANPYHDDSGRFTSAVNTPVQKHPKAPPLLRAVGQGFVYFPPTVGHIEGDSTS